MPDHSGITDMDARPKGKAKARPRPQAGPVDQGFAPDPLSSSSSL